jgi:hypothetical protein
VLGQGHIDITDVIQNSAVDLLRNPFVKTAISGFHMKNRHLMPLGGNRSQTTVSPSFSV